MFTYFTKLLRKRSSRVVCLNENELQIEGKSGSQESAGSVEGGGGGGGSAGGGNLEGINFSNQIIRRDLTKSLSYDSHETHRIDDIYVGKHRPLVPKKYEIQEDVIEEPIYEDIEPNEYQINQLLEIKHYSDGSKSTIFEAKIEQFEKLRPVILKTIRVDDCDVTNSVNDFIYERDLLLSLRHQNIVTLIGHAVDHTCSDAIHRPVLIFEKLNGGSLGEMLARRGLLSRYPIPFLRSLQILRDIASAIKYLHRDYNDEIMILHRDLKPDNICFTSSGTVKLIDFGLCTSVRRSESCLGLYSLTGQTGTMRYMAPEVMCSQQYSEKVDIYSFAIIIWQVLSGLVPFASCDRSDHKQRVCEFNERPDVTLALQRTNDESISYQLHRLLITGWHTDPRERLDILDIYNDLYGLHILQSRIESPILRKRLPTTQTWLHRSLSGL